MKAVKPLFLSFLLTLFALAACVPTEPAAQDTVPITITRVQPTTMAAEPTIIEALTADGRFSIFLSLLETAGLTSVLAGDGPFTLFAPPDSAFNTFPQQLMDRLLAEPDLLDDFLRQHIVIEYLTADDIHDVITFCDEIYSAPSLARHVVYGRNEKGQLTAGNTILLETDLIATNGIIHLIDTPILHYRSSIYWATITWMLFAATSEDSEMERYLNNIGGPYDPTCGMSELYEQLDGTGPYTLFVPQDRAFAELRSQVNHQLDDIVILDPIIRYHILNGRTPTEGESP
jgi:uncharacterized surface protein with fasciclin (FAS1) repeats